MKTIFKYLFVFLCLISFAWCVDLGGTQLGGSLTEEAILQQQAQQQTQQQQYQQQMQMQQTQMQQTQLMQENNNIPQQQEILAAPAVFGAHLFNGNFTQASQFLYNPDYKMAVGDRINFRMWGAVDLQLELVVDTQGNVFIPSVGAVKLLGVKNKDLVEVLKTNVGKIYKSNVFVYADMNVYQSVAVFVTGSVNKPGLYQGLSSDSIVQYLDKAGGINLEYGSFRDIEILRNNKKVLDVDLYHFLLSGKMELFPFRMGDVILVKNLEAYATVSGDVQKPYRFELKNDIKTLQDLAKVSGAKPIVTNAIVKSYLERNVADISAYHKEEFAKVMLRAGDEVEFRPDYVADNINIVIEGEHNGLHSLVVKKGTTLEQALRMVRPNAQSNLAAVQVFRKSVAKQQKKLIEAQLKELETLALTSTSVNSESAAIRANQARLVLEFIERAKQVEPLGQVVIENAKAYEKTILEDGDILNIPAKNNVIVIQGEVALPGAFTFTEGKNVLDYIKLAGDFTERANQKRVIVIRSNGKAERYDNRWYMFSSMPKLQSGDSILVLPEIDSQGLQITSMLSQILYQMAIATKVVIDIADNN